MSRVTYRDAVTGEFVTEEYADAHPATTVGEAADAAPLPTPCQMCSADVTTPNDLNYCTDCAGE